MVAGFAGAGVMRREGKGVVGVAGREVGVWWCSLECKVGSRGGLIS